MTKRQAVFNTIKQQEGHYDVVTVPRAFMELTQDPRAALLLAQLLYWTDRAADASGWVYKTRDEWGAELGLRRYGLDLARRRLKELDLIDETRRIADNRCMLHLRLHVNRLIQALASPDAAPPGDDAGHSQPHPPVHSPAMTSEPSPQPATKHIPESSIHQDRLLGRAKQRQEATARAHVSTDRSVGVLPTGVTTIDRPGLRSSAFRTVDPQPTERSKVDHARTETTTETTPEITPETTAQRATEGRKEELRRQ